MSGDQFEALSSKAELQSKLNDARIPGGAHLTKMIRILEVSEVTVVELISGQPVVPVLFSAFLLRFLGGGESSMLPGAFAVAVLVILRTSICPSRTRASRQG